jgi:hypothetical protein
MAPVWQYFARLQKADESIPAPKGADPGPRSPSPAKPPYSGGPPEGTIIAFLDPRPAAGPS